MVSEHFRAFYKNLNSQPLAQQEESEHLDSMFYGVFSYSIAVYSICSPRGIINIMLIVLLALQVKQFLTQLLLRTS